MPTAHQNREGHTMIVTEVRARDLTVGDTYSEFGMDEWHTIQALLTGSDSVAALDETGHTTWLDSDDVVKVRRIP